MFDNILLISKYTSSQIYISSPDSSHGLQNHISNFQYELPWGYCTATCNSTYFTAELTIFLGNFIPPSVFPVLVHGISILFNTNIGKTWSCLLLAPRLYSYLTFCRLLSKASIIILGLFLIISRLDSLKKKKKVRLFIFERGG